VSEGGGTVEEVWLVLADDARHLSVSATRKQAELTITGFQLSGFLILCAADAGTVGDAVASLGMFPVVGEYHPPADVLDALVAGSQMTVRYEHGQEA
jgi:hypothetical protein